MTQTATTQPRQTGDVLFNASRIGLLVTSVLCILSHILFNIATLIGFGPQHLFEAAANSTLTGVFLFAAIVLVLRYLD